MEPFNQVEKPDLNIFDQQPIDDLQEAEEVYQLAGSYRRPYTAMQDRESLERNNIQRMSNSQIKQYVDSIREEAVEKMNKVYIKVPETWKMPGSGPNDQTLRKLSAKNSRQFSKNFENSTLDSKHMKTADNFNREIPMKPPVANKNQARSGISTVRSGSYWMNKKGGGE